MRVTDKELFSLTQASAAQSGKFIYMLYVPYCNKNSLFHFIFITEMLIKSKKACNCVSEFLFNLQRGE